MVRTQIYLTERQREELAVLARSQGRRQSELIREAIDRLLASSGPRPRQNALKSLAGVWQDRTDLPDLDEVRAGWDRT